MANNPLELITIKKTQIEENELDTALLYEELGRTVSDIAKNKSISYCDEYLTSFSLANDEYYRLKKTQEKFTNIEKNSTSLADEIKNINKKIRINQKEIREIMLRFGAAAYEAYSSKSLNVEIMNLLSAIFEEKQRKIEDLQQKLQRTKSQLLKTVIQNRLNSIRKSLLELFYEAAILIESNDFIDMIPMKDQRSVLSCYRDLKNTESELVYSSKILKSELEELQKKGSAEVKTKLEELKIKIEIAAEDEKNAAVLLGTELYDTLPDDITSYEIGDEAINLIDQITLHKRTIEKIEKDIELLHNELKIEEIKTQIRDKNSDIERLELQIKSCTDQIENIEDSIAEKKSQIDAIVKEGVYIDED
jgi:outer membrane murein-binding lipoprotein Lpp